MTAPTGRRVPEQFGHCCENLQALPAVLEVGERATDRTFLRSTYLDGLFADARDDRLGLLVANLAPECLGLDSRQTVHGRRDVALDEEELTDILDEGRREFGIRNVTVPFTTPG